MNEESGRVQSEDQPMTVVVPPGRTYGIIDTTAGRTPSPDDQPKWVDLFGIDPDYPLPDQSGRSPSPDPRVDIIASVLMWNMDLDAEVQDAPWVMDKDSPRSMAEKIVAALDAETVPAREKT